MTLDDFAALIENVEPNGHRLKGLCPAHDDREASFSFWESEEGWIKMRCFAECTEDEILSALKLENKDLRTATNYAEPDVIYSYVDEHHNELYQALRYNKPNGGKTFKYRHLEDGEWVWNLDGVRRVLYNLPEVIKAVEEGRTIYFVEGEKDVETLREEGKVATCNPMGAGKWRPEYAEFLVGANVVIIADRDDAGRTHAEVVREALTGPANALWVYQAKKGKDVTDHLRVYGLPIEELEEYKPRFRRGIITARELAIAGLEDLELGEGDIPTFQLADAIPLVFRQGRVYPIGGYQGDGKTSYALQGFRKLAEEGRRVGYFSLEMPERDLRNKLAAHKGVPLRFTERPWMLKQSPEALRAYNDAMLEIQDWNADIIFNSGIMADKIVQISQEREYEAVFVDHLHRFGWGKERRSLEEQVAKLTNMALELNIMLVVLCQIRKFSRGKDMESYPLPTLQDFRESSAIGDDASMALSIWRQRDSAGMTYTGGTSVTILKNRHTTGSHDRQGQMFFPTFDEGREMFISTTGGMDGQPAQY